MKKRYVAAPALSLVDPATSYAAWTAGRVHDMPNGHNRPAPGQFCGTRFQRYSRRLGLGGRLR